MKNILKQHQIKMWPAHKIESFQKVLLTWYDQNKRDLPWRNTKDPYHIWISEIMLQQTQVTTVIPYYHKFLEYFPTICKLANCDDTLLLKVWEGLGYYSRARNLKKAAIQIMKKHNGIFPNTYKEVIALSGIGPYTASAILSIAFDQKFAAIDGNAMRVYAKLFEVNLDIKDSKNRIVFQMIGDCLIDTNRPGDFNQAIMDLGSDIYSVHHPKPYKSPLRDFDASIINHTFYDYPISQKKVVIKNEIYIAYLIQNDKGEYLFQKRENANLLKNMWTFPIILQKKVPNPKQLIGCITHQFTHRKWTVYLVHSKRKLDGTFISKNHYQHYPMPTIQLKLLKLLEHQK